MQSNKNACLSLTSLFWSFSDENEDGMAADDEAEERLERKGIRLKVSLTMFFFFFHYVCELFIFSFLGSVSTVFV